MPMVLGGLAEFERDLIHNRTNEGRERAKARGVETGRPSKLSEYQKREAMRPRDSGGETLADIGRSERLDDCETGPLKLPNSLLRIAAASCRRWGLLYAASSGRRCRLSASRWSLIPALYLSCHSSRARLVSPRSRARLVSSLRGTAACFWFVIGHLLSLPFEVPRKFDVLDFFAGNENTDLVSPRLPRPIVSHGIFFLKI
jgi:hypothetical protein